MSRPGIAQPGERQGFEVFCGVDVARETHHAVALDHGGRRLVDRPLPNDEAALRTLFTELTVHGQVLVVVDQPASIGALAIAVARDMGIEVGYLPGLAMRASPMSIRAKARPTRETRSSSRMPPAHCHTRCAGSARMSRPWPRWEFLPDTTPTWPTRRPD
ncbi:hypothetical protein Pen02_79390 [Plantactinospora endophytica]|uniref:Transposase IS110-like N-terminal domain-containing protein n=1 Tax=Plantactinospora endophytica TaxID=673535 RepID=A0ABQ4EE49_9ACTN|nr:hypothetical protein Pen02_79390 [Plantactinospora endophytica]